MVFVVVFIMSIQCYRIHANIQHVLTYESLVKEVLAEDDIKNTTSVDLVLAMIYTETKGKNRRRNDRSKWKFYGGDQLHYRSKRSIRQGVRVLSDNLEEAVHHKVDPWTAVQAYNFGKTYIDYVADNGGVNTVELANAYSKDVVAPSLGNTSGETYTYYQLLPCIMVGENFIQMAEIFITPKKCSWISFWYEYSLVSKSNHLHS